ncbi:MAG TPA: type II secretion system protein [Holophaga sp.]|nr:type II secretion system protein [Holophaga sp.]
MEVAEDSRRGSRGFILAMLLAIMVGMGILLTAVQPSLSAEMQRDQEAELIFRGQAIAAGIRAYKARTGGYPLSLEDLGKLRPRVIRRVYEDPNVPGGEWELITAVQPGASGDTTGLPIVGVRSKWTRNSFKIYNGKDLTSDWAFSAAGNLLGTAAGPAGNLLAPPANTAPGKDPSEIGGKPAEAPKPTP